MNRPKIALVYGRVDADAPPDEQDVLVQVSAVRAALQALGHDTMDVPLSLDLGVPAAVLKAAAPLVVFNLAETIEGKGRLIHLAPCLLDSLDIPYTGSPSEAILVTSHKLLAKKSLRAAGLDTPAWAPAALDGEPSFPPPWIVKSVWEHASIGMEDSSVARSAADLGRELDRRAAREGIDNLFVEQYVEGREFNLALLCAPGESDPESLPPAEIRFVGYPLDKPRVVSYRAKWEEGSFEYAGTPRRFDFPAEDAPLLRELFRMSRECWRLFGLRGYARADFRVDEAGRPWILEVNTNPCLSADAGFMAAAERAGLSMEEVVRRIVEDATRVSLEDGGQKRPA